MSKAVKRVLDDIELNSSSIKRVHHNITCLFDLPNEILLLICRYLPPAYVLYSFYTPETPELRLHQIISDYYKNIKFDQITNIEYNYLFKLFCHSKTPLRPESLILSNENINYLIERSFPKKSENIFQSICINLKHLKLIDCSSKNIQSIHLSIGKPIKLEYVNITIRKFDTKSDTYSNQTCNLFINELLFYEEGPSIHTLFYQNNYGLILNKSLKSHQNIRNIFLFLHTIDDLYILLDGLVPNVQIMTIQLCQSRRLCCHRPQSKPSCLRLTQFTLLESSVGLVISDIKYIFGYMTNLIKLTLSIRDTNDYTFCHGPVFESIITEYLPQLHKFDYTMTHRMEEKTLVEDFVRWTMNVVNYDNENNKYIHIYSLPWPSNKDDKRELPFVENGSNLSVRSDVRICEYIKHVIITESEELFQLKTQFRRACSITTCLSFDIELPSRICKVILTEETPISSIDFVVQPSIVHLTVKRRLNDDGEMLILARQFPHVKYLKLLLPLNELFLDCLKSLYRVDDSIEKKHCIWSELISFSSKLVYEQSDMIRNDSDYYDWFMRNTDLKYNKYPIYVHKPSSILSIWI